MSFATSKRFFDKDNFPHGFSRSGDFTRALALILETKGVVLKALHEGHQPPQTDEEKHFIAMCLEQQPPTTDVEKAWSVYPAVRAAKAVGLNVAGVDILRSNHGPMVMEVNPSPGIQSIEGATDIDVASKIIQFIENTPEKTIPVYLDKDKPAAGIYFRISVTYIGSLDWAAMAAFLRFRRMLQKCMPLMPPL